MFLIINSDREESCIIMDILEKSFPDTFIMKAGCKERGIELISRFHPKIKIVISSIYVHKKTGIKIFKEVHNQFPEVNFILAPGFFARREAKCVGIKYFLPDIFPARKLTRIIRKIKGKKTWSKNLSPA